MTKKKFIVACFFSSLICILVSCLPLIGNLLDNVTEFSYSHMNVNATINEDGSLSMEEEFSLNASGKHTYLREIDYNKDSSSIVCSKSDNGKLDLTSFYVEVVDPVAGTLTASYENQLNPNLGNESDNIIAFSGSRNELGDTIYCEENSSYCKRLEIFLKDGIHKNTVYRLKYKILNAVSVFNDVAILNWKLVPTLSTTKNNVKLTLNYPDNNYLLVNNFEDEGIRYFGFGGSNSSFVENECSNTKIVAKASSLSKDEEMEIFTYFPSSLITSNGGTNYSPHDIKDRIIEFINEIHDLEEEYALEHNIMMWVLIISGIGLIGLLIFLFIRVYNKYDKELKSDFDFEYLRELPATYTPAIMGYLYEEEETNVDHLNATLMDLIRKKYISVDTQGASLTDKNPNYRLVYDRSLDQSTLTEHEKYLLYWYFDVIAGFGNSVTFDEIDAFVDKEKNALKYQECNQHWNKLVKKAGENEKFFEKFDGKLTKYAFIIIPALSYVALSITTSSTFGLYFSCVFAAIISSLAVIFFFYSKQVKRKTRKGIEDYVRWKAFRKFLLDFSQFEDYPVPSVIVWNHFMVYATAFGIAEQVEKQLDTKFEKLSDLQVSNDVDYSVRRNSYFYYRYSYMRFRVHSTIQRGQMTISKAQAERMARSSGSGRGGGFGGGSSFGGGGGRSGVR